MFSSPTVSVVLTAVFVATGGWALYRLAVHASVGDPGVKRATELAHLFMSLAMLAMVWGWSGGPDSGSGIVQLVVFGMFSVWFLAGTLRGSLPSGLHLVSTAAMVWMVVAMPQLMAVAGGSDGDTAATPGMAGMAGMARSPSDANAGTPVAITVVTVLFAVLLAASAGLWARRAFVGSAVAQAAPDESDSGGPGTSRTAVRVTQRVAVRRRVTARLDPCCHALMNLGMGAVLVAML